jgi:hypothetical protein
MNCLQASFCFPFQKCTVAATASILLAACATLLSPPASANEELRRHERDGGGARDLGTGIAIGVVTGIIANELNKPSEPPLRKRKPPKSRSGGNDDGGKPRKPPIDPLLNAGPPKFTWYGFDIFSNGDVRKHEDKPGAPPAVAPPEVPPVPPEAPKVKKDERPTKCIVLSASLKFAGQTANAPLELPVNFTAPVPGTVPANQLGPSDGPIPDTGSFFAGNVFEYHSDLNGVDNCKSNQYKVAWLLSASKETGAIKDTLEFPDPAKKITKFRFQHRYEEHQFLEGRWCQARGNRFVRTRRLCGPYPIWKIALEGRDLFRRHAAENPLGRRAGLGEEAGGHAARCYQCGPPAQPDR